MKKQTDDEIMAKALLCPESGKVPLEVGDRVIALEAFTFFCERIKKGQWGTIAELNRGDCCPWRIRWDGVDGVYWGWYSYPIGKLVKRGMKA